MSGIRDARRMPRPRWPVADRIWGKVDRRGPDECWPWLASTAGKGGYGAFRTDQGKHAIASRFAYELTYGRLSSKKILVRHSCDNPLCCNPAHLVTGTHLDNERDKIRRGRNRKATGEAVATAKLSVAEVLEIRRLYRPYKTTMPQLAKFYGVNQSTIAAVVYGYSWRHL